MAWNPQGGDGGGPWGSGGGGQGGPWGGRPSGPQPPDLEDLLRRGQDRVKRFVPGGPGVSKVVAVVLALAAFAVWLGSGFYKVEAEEQGVVLLFGKYVSTTGPGLHWNFPAPLGTVFKPQVTRVNQVEVGFFSGGNARRGEVTQNVPGESLMLTGDENIIDIQFVTFWVIKDARAFLFNIRHQPATVKDVSEAAMREIIGRSGFEFARTEGRSKIEAEAVELIQRILDTYGAGIEVTEVKLQKIDPPGKVLAAFRDVQAARADKERAINEATAYRSEVIEKAEGQAQRIIREAEAYQAQRVAMATGETKRFLSVLTEYRVDKDVTRRRVYLDTMKDVMSRMDKILIEKGTGGSGVVPYLPLSQLGDGQGRSRTQGAPDMSVSGPTGQSSEERK